MLPRRDGSGNLVDCRLRELKSLTEGLSKDEIVNRLHIGAKRKALHQWPTLVARESARPEPNLIRPRPLVTVNELEDFYFQAMYRNIFPMERQR